MELHGTFPWNSMENVDAGISMEIGVLMFSMEFHGKCPNPPCKYFPWKSMEKFPWNSMEIDVLILLEFHGVFSHGSHFSPDPELLTPTESRHTKCLLGARVQVSS